MIGSKPPSAADLRHMGECKAGPCIPCLVGVSIGLIEPHHAVRGGHSVEGMELDMVQYQHTKSGNVRRGHRHGFGCCLWHHMGTQQLHALGMSKTEALARWGPSLHDSARQFHQTFGSDDELIAAQALVLQLAATGGSISDS